MSDLLSLAPMLSVVVLFALYLAPWIIARFRQHDNSLAIFWLNLLLGWSFIGWIAAFIWALMAQKRGAA